MAIHHMTLSSQVTLGCVKLTIKVNEKRNFGVLDVSEAYPGSDGTGRTPWQFDEKLI